MAVALSDQAALAIENARLVAAAQETAVLEERQRLARDLHDSVTQALYSIALHAQAATRLLAAGDVATDGACICGSCRTRRRRRWRRCGCSSSNCARRCWSRWGWRRPCKPAWTRWKGGPTWQRN